jgi:hypothetical protein
MDCEEARRQAIARLEAKAAEADVKSRDRQWNNGPHNVQRWAAQAFRSAIAVVQRTAPNAGELPAAYLSRVASVVRAGRDDGPDDDDEGWFSGATDEAASTVTAA